MSPSRALTTAEIAELERRGCSAEAWERIAVAEDFHPQQLRNARLEGEIRLGAGACIRNARVRNYVVGEGSSIEDTLAVECRAASPFGNGTPVATMNECGGRTVRIYEGMSAQVAYILAVYRHRPQTIAALERLIDAEVAERTDTLGRIGRGCRIVGCRFLREVRLGDEVVVEGATLLQNATVGDRSRVGFDVKACDLIVDADTLIDRGALVERCFVGESCTLDRGFTASDSLFFANSHCENGEAVSIFAGPYTVSHHKSSLLIAGMFSFFNAGSGANQSNHLFKSGAVHQSVHLRGCKFASNAYVMSPAIEAPYTMIMGRHTHHHDTSLFPYSYLIEKEGASYLIPAANLTSYGTVRDIAKWRQRDRRKVRRDVIHFGEYNPFVGGLLLRAIETLTALYAQDPDRPVYLCNNVRIKSAALQRGIRGYRRALEATLGDLLTRGDEHRAGEGEGRWIDAAGQYLPQQAMERLLDAVETGEADSFAAIADRLHAAAERYDDCARRWALDLLTHLDGKTPDAEAVAAAIRRGEEAHRAFRAATDADCAHDCSMNMAVSYGLDTELAAERETDYKAVRGLE